MNKALEWIATAITLAGAVLTSLDVDPMNIYTLNLGAALWLVWAIREGHRSIAIVNLGMLSAYLYGAYVRNADLLDFSTLLG